VNIYFGISGVIGKKYRFWRYSKTVFFFLRASDNFERRRKNYETGSMQFYQGKIMKLPSNALTDRSISG
jgi:hypothetical protein